jgi:hypothetical protein
VNNRVPPRREHRFTIGQVVRYRGSPALSRRERSNILAIVEFVGRPGPKQEIRVRFTNGTHRSDLAECYTPVRVLAKHTWRKGCVSKHTDPVCIEHGVVPGSPTRASVPDTRSEGAKRYDAERASKLPEWATLGYLSQDEMDRALE